MVKLFRTELTPTGRPVLLHGEVERGMLDKVGVMPGGGGGEPTTLAGVPSTCPLLVPRLQVDLVFYGYAGGVEELPSDEYRVS